MQGMQARGLIVLEEQSKKKGKARPINCELIVHSSFPFSRTRPIAYVYIYAGVCVHLQTHTHPATGNLADCWVHYKAHLKA